MKHKILFALVALLAFQLSVFARQNRLVSQKITLKNGKAFTLNVADGYEIIPAVEGLKRVRFFAKAPDGRLFVTDMYNLSDNTKGVIYILDEFDLKTGKFRKVIPYMSNLKNPNSVQFYKDESGQDWIYLAETDKLTRRKFTKGETSPTDMRPETVATFPDYGLSYKYGGWHLTRTIAFSPAGKLYISVGSSCNACDEKEEVRATVMEMNPDGSNQRYFARGLRNAVGLKWIGNFLWATNQGSDHLGLDKPDETFYALKDGADYGWASCYQANGKIFLDTTPISTIKKPTTRLKSCANVPVSYAYFPARSSAMGFDYFDEATADETIKNSFLVALHGSTNKSIGHGYKIVIMRKGEKLQDFLTGFLQGRIVHGRPLDIMKLNADSFLFTDDFSGIVYYVRKKGSTAQIDIPNAEKTESNQNTQIIETPAPQNSKTCWSLTAALLGICLRSLF
jgi:glucose/arabinose dehydrogenase